MIGNFSWNGCKSEMLGGRQWLGSLHGHFFRRPKANTAPDETQPHHEVILLGTVEVRQLIAEETWMDEEAGNARERVVLFLGVLVLQTPEYQKRTNS
jgi:hypothetical protein